MEPRADGRSFNPRELRFPDRITCLSLNHWKNLGLLVKLSCGKVFALEMRLLTPLSQGYRHRVLS